jgi:tetratricopeptide (TPR) repeat protein
MYFRIYDVPGKEHLVIESDCNLCAGDGAAQLLGVRDEDGYMDKFDFGLIEELRAGDEVHKVACVCLNRAWERWESGCGEINGMEEVDFDETLKDLSEKDKEGLLEQYLAEIRGGKFDSASYNNAVGILLVLGRHSEAERLAREGLGIFRDDPSILHNLAGAVVNQRRYDEGIELLEKSLAVRRDARTLIFLGKVHLDCEHYEDAEECFTLAILDTESSIAYAALAECNMARGDGARALDNFRKATELDPESLAPRAGLAQALSSQRHFADALAECDIILAGDPQNAHILWLKGMCLHESGADFEQVCTHLRWAAEFAPEPENKAAAWYSLGFVLNGAGRRQEACSAYSCAYTLNPGFEEAYIGHALSTDDLDAAREILKLGLEGCSGSVAIRLTLSGILINRAEYEEAFKVLNGARAENAGDVFALGEARYTALTHLERWEDAVRTLTEMGGVVNGEGEEAAAFPALLDKDFARAACEAAREYERAAGDYNAVARMACVLALLRCDAVEEDIRMLFGQLTSLDSGRAQVLVRRLTEWKLDAPTDTGRLIEMLISNKPDEGERA